MKQYLVLISQKTKQRCLLMMVLACIGAVLASLIPVKLGNLYNGIAQGTIGSIAQGMDALMLFGLLALSAECITILRRVMLDCIIASHESEVRESSIEKLLKMPVSYYTGCLTGEKTAQLNQGVAGLSQLIKIMCNDVLPTVLTAGCTFVQVFLNAPAALVWIMMAYVILTVLISVIQIHSQNGIREEIIGQKNALDGQVCQAIANLELIRSMVAERYEKIRLHPAVSCICRTEQKHHRAMGLFDISKQACRIVFQILLLVVSMLQISRGNMEAGAVITVCLLFQQLVRPIEDIYRFMDETASSMIKAKVLSEVMEGNCDEIFAVCSSDKPAEGNEIRVENVVVTNPEKSKELARYDRLILPCSGVVALKGVSGSGKTSLIRCLNRYYPHTQGHITLFGKDQSEVSQQELAQMVYYTPQESFFIAGTVRENLVYGLERKVTEEELTDALCRVNLESLGSRGTAQMNVGQTLEFRISENAKELSGGQKQRLSLARAFLRRPKVFIFDEITANLDQSSVESVLREIEDYARKIGAGIIYISHDQNVVNRCSQQIMLRNSLKKK